MLLGSTQQVIQVNIFPFQGNHLDLLVSSHLVFTSNDSVSGVTGITYMLSCSFILKANSTHLNLPALPTEVGAYEALKPIEPLLRDPLALLKTDPLFY